MASIIINEGSVATGDGGIEITYSLLKEGLGYYLGYWSNRDGWTIPTVDQPADLEAIIKGGIRRTYAPVPIPPSKYGHKWSFLYPISTLTLEADEDTYDLPTDFGGMAGPLTYAPDDSVLHTPIEIVSEFQVRNRLAQYPSTGRPTIAATRPKEGNYITGTRYEIILCPTSNGVYNLRYRYRVGLQPLNGANPIPLGGPEFGQLLLAACLAEAEAVVHDKPGPKHELFMQQLAAAVSHDQMLAAPDTLGYNRDPSINRLSSADDCWDYERNSGIVTYEPYTS